MREEFPSLAWSLAAWAGRSGRWFTRAGCAPCQGQEMEVPHRECHLLPCPRLHHRPAQPQPQPLCTTSSPGKLTPSAAEVAPHPAVGPPIPPWGARHLHPLFFIPLSSSSSILGCWSATNVNTESGRNGWNRGEWNELRWCKNVLKATHNFPLTLRLLPQVCV